MLVTDRPRPLNGRIVVMHGDQEQQPSALGAVTAEPHALPLPSGSYDDKRGGGQDTARVWLIPADFAALCACMKDGDTALTLAHNGSVVTSFSFVKVDSPLHSMARSLEALEHRVNALEPGALHADLTAIREGVEELLRRLPEIRHSDVVPRGDFREFDDAEPVMPLIPRSAKKTAS
jgi:hypothetical protein